MSERRYPFIAYQFDTDEGLEWIVKFPDVPGVSGGGKTESEALEDALDNLEAHLNFLQEDGIPLPTPSDFQENEYSGKLSLRISKSMHEKISLLAKKEGVSINQLINEAIIEKVTKDNDAILADRVFEQTLKLYNKLEFGKNIRYINTDFYKENFPLKTNTMMGWS